MDPQSNYDFILNPAKPPKKSFNPFGSLGTGSMTKKIIAIVGAGIVLIIVIVIISSLFSGGTSTQQSLTGIAQTQTEIVRVAKEGGEQAAASSNQTLAINVQLTLGTQTQALVAFLAKYNVTLDSKTLVLKADTNTDKELTTAQQNSTYDVVFAQIMQTEMTSYLRELQTAYNAIKTPKVRALLSKDFTQTTTLLKEVPTSASLTDS